MYHKYHTKGVVLDCIPKGEFDNSVLILSEELGLIWVQAISSRKKVSKMQSGIQFFSSGYYSLINSKSGFRLVGVNVFKNYFEELKSYKERLIIATNITLLLRKVLVTREKNEQLFCVIENFFEFLIESPQKYLSSSECLATMRILQNTGFLGIHNEFKKFTSEYSIDVDTLEQITDRRIEMVKIINNSLKTASLVS